MGAALFDIADILLQVLTWIIILQVVLSWLLAFNVINPHSQGMRSFIAALDRIMDPFYRPIRKILPDFGGIDFSPLVLILAIQIIRRLLLGVRMEVLY